MLAKQLSVFIENRQGRLHEVLDVLKKNNINILSLSLADTTEYGLLRLIVNDPDLGKEKLSEAGFSIMITDILVINIEHKSGSLQVLLETMSLKGINIEYMYGLSVDGNDAYVVLKTSDSDEATQILKSVGVKLLSNEDIKGLK